MSRIRVGVLRGGASPEYSTSLHSGAAVLAHLNPSRYEVRDILLTKKGEWIIDGLLTAPEECGTHIDVLWNALKGGDGENGKLQQRLEQFKIPYTGAPIFPSALAMRKRLAKERFKELRVRTPASITIEAEDDIEEGLFRAFQHFAFPLIVKPDSAGSAVGVSVARSYDALRDAVEATMQYGAVIIEEYIRGKEASVIVIDTDHDMHYPLFPVEVIHASEFLDQPRREAGEYAMRCPGNFSIREHSELRHLATRIHAAFGLRHFSKTDFIVSPRGIYALEVNSLPSLKVGDVMHRALEEHNIPLSDFVGHVVELARKSARQV